MAQSGSRDSNKCDVYLNKTALTDIEQIIRKLQTEIQQILANPDLCRLLKPGSMVHSNYLKTCNWTYRVNK